MAARAEAAAAERAAGRGASGGGPGGLGAPPLAGENSGGVGLGTRARDALVDDDGFQRVVRRGSRRNDGPADVSGTEGARGEGQPRQQDPAAGTTGAEDNGGDCEGDEAPTTAELHQAWLGEVALVKKLRAQGVQGDHPALRAACEARDAAEQAWRGSKEPAPASVRLGRAQAKLERAVTLQAEARQAIIEAEQAHKQHMQSLQATMDDCAERVRVRRQQLRDIQGEVGAGVAHDAEGGQTRAQQEALRQVHQTICTEVGPTIEALVEQVGSDTPAWTALNGLLAKLSASKAALEGAYPPQQTDHFDIGGGGRDEWEAQSAWSESHDLHGQHWGGGHGDGPGHDDDDWGARQRQGPGAHDYVTDDDHDQGADQSMGTGDWWDSSPTRHWGGEGTRWQPSGHSKWRRASWADQSEGDLRGEEEDDGPPAAARRRLGAAPTGRGDDLAQSGDASAATATQVRNDDAETRKRLHGERLERVVAAAIDAGINPVTERGEDLRLLDTHQLDAWVEENLTGR